MKLDFKVISTVPFKKILDTLNIRYSETMDGRLKGENLVVDIEKNFYFDPYNKTEIWGSPIDYWARNKKISKYEAASEIHKLFFSKEEPQEEKKEPPTYPFIYHDYLKEKGITPEDAESFGFTYCKKGILRGSIAIQINDPNGVKVGYIGKHIKDDRYFYPKQFSAGDYLFNLDKVKGQKSITLTSSPFKAMELKDQNPVSLLTPYLTDNQLELLKVFDLITISHPKENLVLRLSKVCFVKQI